MTQKPIDRLFVGCEGDLYDTSDPNWHHNPPLRREFKRTFTAIETVSQLKATLRNGRFAWPGGYPLFFVTNDGACLSWQAVLDNLPECYAGIKAQDESGWNIVACDVNWESELYCDHSGDRIESAYGHDENEN